MAEDNELEKRAVEELLRETDRARIRAETMGPAGWMKCPLQSTNKRFLLNTLRSTGLQRHSDDSPPRRSTSGRRRRSESPKRRGDRSRSPRRECRSTERHTDRKHHHKHSDKAKSRDDDDDDDRQRSHKHRHREDERHSKGSRKTDRDKH